MQAEAARLKAKEEQERARVEAQILERDQTILNIEKEVAAPTESAQPQSVVAAPVRSI